MGECRRMMEEAQRVQPVSLEERLGVTLQDHRLLEQALLHQSFLNENPGYPIGSNERLEFLGDALIGLVVALELYTRCPDVAEGELTRLRAHLVKRETLAQIARELGLGEALQMGRGEASTGGRERESNLAAVVEAVLGAVYLDQGYDVAREVTLRVLRHALERTLADGIPTDPKSALQERVQAMGLSAPQYRVVEAVGPEHAKSFTVEVLIGGRVLGVGQGRKKAHAEREAARTALHAVRSPGAADALRMPARPSGVARGDGGAKVSVGEAREDAQPSSSGAARSTEGEAHANRRVSRLARGLLGRLSRRSDQRQPGE